MSRHLARPQVRPVVHRHRVHPVPHLARPQVRPAAHPLARPQVSRHLVHHLARLAVHLHLVVSATGRPQVHHHRLVHRHLSR